MGIPYLMTATHNMYQKGVDHHNGDIGGDGLDDGGEEKGRLKHLPNVKKFGEISLDKVKS